MTIVATAVAHVVISASSLYTGLEFFSHKLVMHYFMAVKNADTVKIVELSNNIHTSPSHGHVWENSKISQILKGYKHTLKQENHRGST